MPGLFVSERPDWRGSDMGRSYRARIRIGTAFSMASAISSAEGKSVENGHLPSFACPHASPVRESGWGGTVFNVTNQVPVDSDGIRTAR
jgi:hypothetical protein